MSAYKVEGIEQGSSDQKVSAKTVKVDAPVDIGALLAMGDVAHGEKVFKKCSACHMIAADGKNKIGPKSGPQNKIGQNPSSKKNKKI